MANDLPPDRLDAADDTDDTERALLDRRSYLKMAGAAASIAASGVASAGSSTNTTPVDIEDGSDVASVLSNISDGDTVVLPENGTFTLGSEPVVDADDWTFDGNGSTIQVTDEVRLHLRGSGWDFGYVNFEPQNDVDPQNWVCVWTRGTDWRCHHLAWTRENRTYWGQNGDYGRMSMFVAGTDKGGYGEITDCWMGAGWRGDNGWYAITPFNLGDGELWLRRCYLRNGGTYFTSNADSPYSDTDQIYSEGTLNVDTCYFEACYINAVRTGAHYGTCTVKNTVLNQSRDVMEDVPWSRGDTREEGQWAARGIHDYSGPIDAYDLEVDATGDEPSGTSVHRALDVLDWGLRQTPSISMHSGNLRGKTNGAVTVADGVGDDPDLTPPDGVPLSPKEAYQAGSDGGSDDGSDGGSDDGSDGGSDDGSDGGSDDGSGDTGESYAHTLAIEGTGTATNYEFTVSGALAPGAADDLEEWDVVDGTSASGWVTSETQVDTYTFEGVVTDFSFVEGSGAVFLDGKEVDPKELVADHTLTIEGAGTATNYEFTVDEDLVARTDDTLEEWDSIDGTTASGWVTAGTQRDKFAFDGELQEFSFVEGEAVVFLDGTEVDPEELASDHTLTIEGTGTPTNYRFSVSDSLAPVDDQTLEQWDDVTNTTADGWVTEPSQRDTYTFDGRVTAFDFPKGEATVYLDGEEVTPDQLVGEHTLRIEGRGTPTNYRFTVSDSLAPDQEADDLEEWDSIDGRTADGWITTEQQVDTYHVTGIIESFEFPKGEATVYLDDSDVTEALVQGE